MYEIRLVCGVLLSRVFVCVILAPSGLILFPSSERRVFHSLELQTRNRGPVTLRLIKFATNVRHIIATVNKLGQVSLQRSIGFVQKNQARAESPHTLLTRVVCYFMPSAVTGSSTGLNFEAVDPSAGKLARTRRLAILLVLGVAFALNGVSQSFFQDINHFPSSQGEWAKSVVGFSES